MLAPATIIGGRYKVLECVGEGGGGCVYRCFHTDLECQIAVKVLHSSLIMDDESRERFDREAKILCAINHPNVALFYQIGIHEGTPFIAMEFLAGKSLQQIIDENGKLPWSMAVRFGIDMCMALAEIHRCGIVHRDIKPGNFILTTDGVIKLVDFGLARSCAAETLTSTGLLIGSIHFMSPEACQGRTVDHLTDIYSFGCTLYTALFGAPPCQAESPIGVLHFHVQSEPDFDHKDVEVPEALIRLVSKCLRKQPQQRFSNAKAVADELELIATNPGEMFKAAVKSKTVSRLPLLMCGILALVVMSLIASRSSVKEDEKLPVIPAAHKVSREYHLRQRIKQLTSLAAVGKIQVDSFLSVQDRAWILEELARNTNTPNDRRGFACYCLGMDSALPTRALWFDKAIKYCSEFLDHHEEMNLEACAVIEILCKVYILRNEYNRAYRALKPVLSGVAESGPSTGERIDCYRLLGETSGYTGRNTEYKRWMEEYIRCQNNRMSAGAEVNFRYSNLVSEDKYRPELAAAYARKARSQFMSGELDRSKESIRLCKNYASNVASPGMLLVAAKACAFIDYDAGRFLYERTIAAGDSNEAKARLSLVELLIAGGQYHEAEKWLVPVSQQLGAENGLLYPKLLAQVIGIKRGLGQNCHDCYQSLNKLAHDPYVPWPIKVDALSFLFVEYSRDKESNCSRQCLRELVPYARRMSSSQAIKLIKLLLRNDMATEALDVCTTLSQIHTNGEVGQLFKIQQVVALVSSGKIAQAQSLSKELSAEIQSPDKLAAPVVQAETRRMQALSSGSTTEQSIEELKQANQIYLSNGLSVYPPRLQVLRELTAQLKVTGRTKLYAKYQRNVEEISRQLQAIPVSEELPLTPDFVSEW